MKLSLMQMNDNLYDEKMQDFILNLLNNLVEVKITATKNE